MKVEVNIDLYCYHCGNKLEAIEDIWDDRPYNCGHEQAYSAKSYDPGHTIIKVTPCPKCLGEQN